MFAALFSQRNDNGPDLLANRNPSTELSNPATLGAAQTLANRFGSDRGVVIELLDEPFGSPATGGDAACGSGGHSGTLVQWSFAGSLGGLDNHPPVITAVDAPAQVASGGAAVINITAHDPDEVGGLSEPIGYSVRLASDGNGADSEPVYGGAVTWHADGGTGMRRLTVSAVDPFGGRDEHMVDIMLP